MWYSNCTVTRIKYPALVFALNRYNFAIYSHRPNYIAFLVPDSRRATTRNINKGNNKITELRTILQRESQNS